MKVYALRRISVQCPKCEQVFATMQAFRMPKISLQSKVEADLHRVLPDAFIRASLLSTCPECIYTWWQSAFRTSFMLPAMVPDAPPVSNAKKFGHAVLTGRKEGAHALDRAMVAMNGYWCAREDWQDGAKWLELASRELAEALSDESWVGNRSRYNYIMGEVQRLLGNFDQAIKYFGMVNRRSALPKELVVHQTNQARQGNSRPITLPPHIIDGVFKLSPVIITPEKPENEAPFPYQVISHNTATA